MTRSNCLEGSYVKLRLWMHPRCWPCLFFLTCIGVVFAISGAADIWSAVAMVGTGLAFDIGRWLARPQWLSREYWIDAFRMTLDDPDYAGRGRRAERRWLIPITLVFLLHGMLWVVLAPRGAGAAMSGLADLYPEPSIILRISHIARSYVTTLNEQGLPARGLLWERFFFETFLIYIFFTLLAMWRWWKDVTILTFYRRHDMALKRKRGLCPVPAGLAAMGLLTAFGFLAVNNLVTEHSLLQKNDPAGNNVFFMTYSVQMLFVCLLSGYVYTVSILYCFDADTGSGTEPEEESK